jgi:hypothetical protein
MNEQPCVPRTDLWVLIVDSMATVYAVSENGAVDRR